MTEKMIAQATLKAGMCFDVEADSGHSVLLDASEQSGGQNVGFRPMEMLLVGLAGCTGMDVIAILRKKRQQVTGYTVRVQGIRAKEHPQVFTEILVEHIVTGQNLQPGAVARAVQLSEVRYCSVGAMLGKSAHLTHTFRIIDTAKTEKTSPVDKPTLIATMY